jgi:O-antigen ligase
MKYIFLIIVGVIFTLGQFARVQLGNVGVTFIDLTVVFISLVWAIKSILIEKQKIKIADIDKLVIGFFISGLIGLALFSNNLSITETGVALLYLVRLICYLSLFYIVKNLGVSEKTKVLKVLMASGSVIVGIGFLQYFFYQSLANLRYLGWDEHLYRLFSTFLDPNFAGAFFAIFLLILLELIITSTETKKRLLLSLLLILTFIAELLTYSRTGFIMLLVGVGVFLLSFVGKKVTVITLLFCIILFFAASNSKIEGLNPFRVVSSEARLNSARDAISIIEKHPIFGVGYNSYRYAQVKMGFRQELPKIQSHSDAGTDNSYLFAIATTGVVGGLFFALCLVRILRKGWIMSTQEAFLGRTFFASLIAVLVGSLFLNILFYPMILGWLLVEGALIRSKKP